MKAIVCVDKKWGIGKNNDLLFHLPEDMRHFVSHTMGKVVVMGSNTLLSFPNGKPLKNRTNIVLWPDGERDDVIVVRSLQELSDELKKYDSDDVFIIGGAMFYRTMLDFCSEVIVTKVNADGGATVFFENLDERQGWRLKEETEYMVAENGKEYKFSVYTNDEVKDF